MGRLENKGAFPTDFCKIILRVETLFDINTLAFYYSVYYFVQKKHYSI